MLAGAKEAAKGTADDRAAAGYFQSLLEVGYLVASADGLAPEERDALAQLVEHATVSAVNRETLRLHFDDLGAGSDMLGRRERLARVAADLETPEARDEAIRFGTLVGIADGTLDPAEMDVLWELGSHFSLQPDEVTTIIESVASGIEEVLRS
jgi:tellurite resistance protein